MALIRGNNLNNFLFGTDGDDMFVGLGGNDTLNGGAGSDTSWYSGNLAGYAFSSVAGRLVVRDIAPADGSDGADSLAQIEKLQFGDVQLAVTASEFRINTTTVNTQLTPSITALADGGYLASWQSVGQDGSDYGIFAQRYDARGQAVGGEVQVNTYTTNAQQFSATAELTNGGFVVAWSSLGQDGDSWGIYAQRYSPDGAAMGAEFRVNTYVTNAQIGPAMTGLADGGFVVAWTSTGQDGAGGGVYAQRYDASGVAAGAEFRINATTASEQGIQAGGLEALAGGGFVAIWSAFGQDGDSSGIYGRLYDAEGDAMPGPAGEFRVNTTTASTQIQAEVAALAGGGFVVSWMSIGQDGSIDGVYAQRYGAGGVAAGAEFRVNTYTVDSQHETAVAGLADGGFVITWSSDNQDGDEHGIYGQRYDAAGVTVGAEFRVNTYTAASQLEPSVAGLADGGFIISWTSGFGQEDLYGVYAQRYDANGDPVGLQLTGSGTAETINLDAGQLLRVDAGGGNDTVNGAGGDDVLLGGAGNDALRGNAGNDLLDGGVGNDNLTGGVGDDDYVVDSLTDVLTEAAGGGNDNVASSMNWTLALNFENLKLTGSGNVNATGNAGGNLLEGNSGNNVLDGKAGVDIMSGGGGDDTYVVDNLFDFVDEVLSAGIDTVQSSVAFMLPENVEKLTLTGVTVINGTGNEEHNTITGNSAANVLSGLDGGDTMHGMAGHDSLGGGAGNDSLAGGAGNDTLTGGADIDAFVFNVAPVAGNLDTVTDFVAGVDVVVLSKAIFTTAGTIGLYLPAGQFRAGDGFTTGADADDRIIYNELTGDLYYDNDGNGAMASVKFAVLTGAPALSAGDIFVTS